MTPNKNIEEQWRLEKQRNKECADKMSSELEKQRQSIIEELEGMYYKPEAPEELKIDSHQVFFNQALELAISKIKEKHD